MLRIIDAAGLTNVNVKGFDGENKTKWRRRSEARATSTLASGCVTIEQHGLLLECEFKDSSAI